MLNFLLIYRRIRTETDKGGVLDPEAWQKIVEGFKDTIEIGEKVIEEKTFH